MKKQLTMAAALAALLAASVPALAAEASAQENLNPLAPTEADMEKARAEREAGRAPEPPAKNTPIEQVRDQNNRVTEYVVTPGSTHIPYVIDNQSERPADNTPGGNSKSTLGTTKLIRIGW